MDEQDDDATYLLIDVTGDVAESDLQPGAKLHIKVCSERCASQRSCTAGDEQPHSCP